jgi:hypothetical protein
VARPRKPEDPQRWPTRCARCRGHYKIVAAWPDGSICGYCYQAAKRTTGICACGHQGVLPGVTNDRPACRPCGGVKLNVDCISCGDETEIYSGGRCLRCVLGTTAQRLLTNPNTNAIAPQLQIIVDALTAMHRPNSGLTWIRQPHVQSVLCELACHPTLTHEVFDRLPASRTSNYMRGLLVGHQRTVVVRVGHVLADVELRARRVRVGRRRARGLLIPVTTTSSGRSAPSAE